VLESLAGQRVDGVIAACARTGDADRILEFDKNVAPVVLAVRRLPGSGLTTICADDVAGGRLAGGYLVALGHTRLVQFAGPADVQPFVDRGVGFVEAAMELGADVVDLSDRAEHPTYEEGVRMMHRLIAMSSTLPTALFAHNDPMAIGAIDALRSIGMRCPKHLSVVGYNDDPYINKFSPALSTVRTSSSEIGALAADALLRRLMGDDQLDDTFLTPTLVPRDSSRRASS